MPTDRLTLPSPRFSSESYKWRASSLGAEIPKIDSADPAKEIGADAACKSKIPERTIECMLKRKVCEQTERR
jgi:hypothetical protein